MLAEPAAVSANGLSLPYAPSAPGGQDSVETAGGARCRSSINTNGPTLDIGLGHVSDRGYSRSGGAKEQNYIGYARVIIPLGKKPSRLDCSLLYELELARLRMEIELMKMGE